MEKDINRLKKFPEYRNAELENIPSSVVEVEFLEVSKDPELIKLIFAPDPVTGIPRSDLAVVMSKDTAPEVAQYIRDNLLTPLPDSVSAGDDPDLAIAGIKQRDVSFEDYAKGLREVASKNESNSKK